MVIEYQSLQNINNPVYQSMFSKAIYLHTVSIVSLTPAKLNSMITYSGGQRSSRAGSLGIHSDRKNCLASPEVPLISWVARHGGISIENCQVMKVG